MGPRAHGYYLAALDLAGARALVVGGDAEAASRAERLVDAGARVTFVWPEASPEVLGLARRGAAQWLARELVEDDVRGCRLVVVVPRDAELVGRVARAARRERAWVSAVDQVAHSDLAQVAVVRQGELQIGISSSGAAPAVARRLREGLARAFDGRLDRLIDHVARARADLAGRTMEERRAVMHRILEGLSIEATIRYPAWIEDGRLDAAVPGAGSAQERA